MTARKDLEPNVVGSASAKHQLTHLPGVREFLREQAERKDRNEFQLNMLAEFGPQNLEEAWAYFKHWVKRRPIGPEFCLENGAEGGLSINPFLYWKKNNTGARGAAGGSCASTRACTRGNARGASRM